MRNRLAFVTVLALSLAACGGGDASGVDIEGAWARTSPAMATAGAAYMSITANADDSLVSVSADPDIAGAVEIHETVMADDGSTEGSMAGNAGTTDDTMGDMTGGAMSMQQVESLTLPAGETVALEPGGYHIMLLDLPNPLETGETFDLTLTFENAGEQVVSVEVRQEAP